jgi:hypothetical protein
MAAIRGLSRTPAPGDSRANCRICLSP